MRIVRGGVSGMARSVWEKRGGAQEECGRSVGDGERTARVWGVCVSVGRASAGRIFGHKNEAGVRTALCRAARGACRERIVGGVSEEYNIVGWRGSEGGRSMWRVSEGGVGWRGSEGAEGESAV